MTFGIGRRDFITLLGGAAATWPLTALAQQSAASTARRIGLLLPGVAPRWRCGVSRRGQGLKEYSWVEGQNISRRVPFLPRVKRTRFRGSPPS
jgi:hypothetical protein